MAQEQIVEERMKENRKLLADGKKVGLENILGRDWTMKKVDYKGYYEIPCFEPNCESYFGVNVNMGDKQDSGDMYIFKDKSVVIVNERWPTNGFPFETMSLYSPEGKHLMTKYTVDPECTSKTKGYIGVSLPDSDGKTPGKYKYLQVKNISDNKYEWTTEWYDQQGNIVSRKTKIRDCDYTRSVYL